MDFSEGRHVKDDNVEGGVVGIGLVGLLGMMKRTNSTNKVLFPTF